MHTRYLFYQAWSVVMMMLLNNNNNNDMRCVLYYYIHVCIPANQNMESRLVVVFRSNACNVVGCAPNSRHFPTE